MATSYKLCCAIVLLLFFPDFLCAQPAYTEAEIIRYAKAIDVAQLEASLSSQRLDDWLRSGPPRLETVGWAMSPNCDQKAVAGDVMEVLPLCVRVWFERGRVEGWITITAGTIGKGAFGPPHVREIQVEQRLRDQREGDYYLDGTSANLADLPVLLEEVTYTVERKDVIAYAKALDVAKLDPSLSSQHLEDWLRSGPAQDHRVTWGVRFDCETRPKQQIMPADDSPLCVTVVMSKRDVAAWATMVVGTFGKGLGGPPQLKFVAVQPMSGDERGRLMSDKLSDLPRLLHRLLPSTKNQ